MGRGRGKGVTVNGVTDYGVSCAFALQNDHILFFLRHNDGNFAAIFHCVKEDLVSKDIKFLLVVSRGIRRSGQTEEVNQRRTTNIMCNEFTSQLQAVQISMDTKAIGTGGVRIEKDSQISSCRLSDLLLFLKNKLRNISHMNFPKAG